MRELNIKIGTGFILAFDLTSQETLASLTDLRETIVNIKSNNLNFQFKIQYKIKWPILKIKKQKIFQ
jgi:hypothetical protein